MATFRQADADCTAMIQELIQKYHTDLLEAGVRVGARFAYAAINEKTGEPRGPALKFHGYAAAAIVRIISQKDRVSGMPDAMIDVDGRAWTDEWADERKQATIDHELLHLLVVKDDEGNVTLDDCHRPKLKMRLHDWELGGFADIAKRYKEQAIEVESARAMADKFGQLLFPW